jgi:hypothetical protein
VEQELLTLPQHLSSSYFFMRFVFTTTTGQAKTFDNVLIAEEQEEFVDAK